MESRITPHQSPIAWINGLTSASFVKPPYSYIGLIAQAILENPERRLLLSEIYEAIQKRYPFFLAKGNGWRNSVRHNLSLNDCFVKAGRAPNGKSSYWTIHPANVDDFARGDFRRKQAQWKVKSHDVRAFANQMGLWGWQPVPVRNECQKRGHGDETGMQMEFEDFIAMSSTGRRPGRPKGSRSKKQPLTDAEVTKTDEKHGPQTRSRKTANIRPAVILPTNPTLRSRTVEHHTHEESTSSLAPTDPSTSGSPSTKPNLQRSPSQSLPPVRRSARMAAHPPQKLWHSKRERPSTPPLRCVVTTDGFGRDRVVAILDEGAEHGPLIGDERIAYVVFEGDSIRVVPDPN